MPLIIDDLTVELLYDFAKNPQCAKDFRCGASCKPESDGLHFNQTGDMKDKDLMFIPLFQPGTLRAEFVTQAPE